MSKSLATTPIPRYETMKRRALLLRIMQESKDNPTYDQLLERMMMHQWVLDRWPDYSVELAKRDMSYVFSLVKEDIRALSNVYLVRQLGVIEEVVGELRDIALDREIKPHTRISALAAIGPYLDKEIRMMGNYDNSKDISISKTDVTVNLDKFLELQQKAQAQRDEYIIDSTIVEEGLIDEEE